MTAMFRSAAVALAFMGGVSAQSSSVISVFLPDTDQQTLVGSLVASDATKTTIAFGCPAGEDSDDCGFGGVQVTATFGSSTLAYTQTLDSLTLGLACAVTGTTAATCTQTYVGPAGYLEEATATGDSLTASDASFNNQITTSVTSSTLAPSDITFIPITLTAFANAASGTSAGTGASASVSGATSTSQGTHTTGSATGSATHSGNATSPTHTGAAIAMGGSQGKWMIGTAGLLGLAFILQ